MNCKQLLKFYFFAESLDKALNDLIMRSACDYDEFMRGCEYGADKICGLIEEKCRLGELWEYLDGIMGTFSVGERKILKFYGGLRTGTSRLKEEWRREIKRVTVKFVRRARGLGRFGEGMGLVKRYFCLITAY